MPPVLNPAHQAEALAARFPPLLVAAERVAATVSMGVHGRRRAGTGETFWQYRRYMPGDGAGGIDWRRSAAGDTLFIRETEWEAAQGVWLSTDQSASMNYRSRRSLPFKKDHACLLTSALACLLVRGGERVTNLASGERPATGRFALAQFAHGLETTQQTEPDLAVRRDLPRHATLVMASDFLHPLKDIAATITAYARQGVRGHLVQILDPAEESFPFKGRVLFTAMGANDAVLIGRAEDVQDDYRAALIRHRDGLAQLARSLGWSFVTHRTDTPPHLSLLGLVARMAG